MTKKCWHREFPTDDSWTGTVLTITITAKTADDMRAQYSFTEQQNNTLDELLENLDLIGGLIGTWL